MTDKELINHLQKKNAEYIETIQALKSNKWISVKDKLPLLQNIDNSSQDCLIAIKYGYDMQGEPSTLCTGYLLNNEWWAYQDHNCHKIGDGIYKGDKVTHWMPLPEPPKEA